MRIAKNSKPNTADAPKRVFLLTFVFVSSLSSIRVSRWLLKKEKEKDPIQVFLLRRRKEKQYSF